MFSFTKTVLFSYCLASSSIVFLIGSGSVESLIGSAYTYVFEIEDELHPPAGLQRAAILSCLKST